MRSFVFIFAALIGSATPAAAFMSPEGAHRVAVKVGANEKGSDVKPLTAEIFRSTGAPVRVSFQLIRYSEPTEQTVREAFLWPRGEAAVAIENRSTHSNRGFRVVPLQPGLPWKMKDLAASEVQWVDDHRLVYRADDPSAGTFIGVFNARDGRVRTAHRNVSMAMSFQILDVGPATITFREQTSGIHHDVCYSFNTATGARKSVPCPKQTP